MVLNGISYGQAMGLDTEIARMALESGALAAGISGTGPATVILCEKFNVEPIIKKIGYEGTLETRINHTKATVL